jgi:hypothetical protein
MLFDDERSLAWALVEATTPHLSTAQRATKIPRIVVPGVGV